METERSPLGSRTVPRYTFLGSGNPPKEKYGRFRCCFWATVTVVLVVVLVILLSYLLGTSGLGEKTSSNISESLNDLLQLQWPIPEEKYVDLMGELKDEVGALEAGSQGLKDREAVEEVLPPLEVDSPEFRHQLATHTSKQARSISKLGYLLNLASKKLQKCRDNETTERKPMRRWMVSRLPGEYSLQHANIKCSVSSYRTANGSCNNFANPTWGAALSTFRRILLPHYEDDVSEPRKAVGGSSLPSARELSLAIHRPSFENDVNFTAMLAVWGQFIDHDMAATAVSRGKDGSPIKCCQTMQTHPECFPVLLKESDPLRLRRGVSCLEFVRSAPAPTPTFGPREQMNQATTFLDGSVVYGSDDEFTKELRVFRGGELKMLKSSGGDLLPVSEEANDGCNRKEEFERGRYCFLSGDKRSNENLLLTSMHLLFARQHNLIARELSQINTHWTDEKLFQESKKILGAQIQHITYNEFLPCILPEKLMDRLDLSTKSRPRKDSYNSSVDPTIANVFAAAAFRFGHTLLPGLMLHLRKNSTQKEYVELHKMLFNPFQLFEDEFLENFMKSVMNTSSAKADVHVTQELTEKLFQKEPKNSYGLDLVSLNIQRGRDHGIPSYPNWRKLCGLRKPENFHDLKNDIDEETLDKLKMWYKSVNDVDLYTGGLAEEPVAGGLVGPTITCLLADQFLRLKIGDRYWYDRTEGLQRFTRNQLKEIRKTTLSKIICKTSEVGECQSYVMRRVEINNKVKPCQEFVYPNLEPWREQ